jgi:hypothetical protein
MVTEFAGSSAPAADMNYQFTPPLCQVTQQGLTAQSGWTSATATAVTFGAGSTVIDTDGIHSESSLTSHLVIGKRLGWWQIDGVYCPASNPTGALFSTARAIIYKNGTAVSGSFGGIAGTLNVFLSVPTKPGLLVQATAASDYVELMGYQTASGTGNVIGTAVSSPYVASGITARWVRDS